MQKIMGNKIDENFCLSKPVYVLGYLTLCMLGNFTLFLLPDDFFKINFIDSFRNAISVSNSLYPGQAVTFFWSWSIMFAKTISK